VVITEEAVYQTGADARTELQKLLDCRRSWRRRGGFDPVVIGHTMRAADPIDPEKQVMVDTIGIVTIHDGPRSRPARSSRRRWQRPGGRELPQQLPGPGELPPRRRAPRAAVRPAHRGTYFLNRWFCTVEAHPKTVVPIGYVGVVVSSTARSART